MDEVRKVGRMRPEEGLTDEGRVRLGGAFWWKHQSVPKAEGNKGKWSPRCEHDGGRWLLIDERWRRLTGDEGD